MGPINFGPLVWFAVVGIVAILLGILTALGFLIYLLISALS